MMRRGRYLPRWPASPGRELSGERSSMTRTAAVAHAPDAQTVLPAATGTIHPLWVRVTHWINVVAMFVMITSGWRIYDASPLFRFTFPPAITIGDGLDGLPGALLWHFAAMWLLVVNGVVYVGLGLLTGRFRKKLLPIRPG